LLLKTRTACISFLALKSRNHEMGSYSLKRNVSDLLRRVAMMQCKEVATPLSTSEKLSTHGEGGALGAVDSTKYCSVGGAL
jgi:hypothetical protein